MAHHIPSAWTTATVVAVMVVTIAVCMSATEAQSGLAFGFYGQSCPDAEAIVYKILDKEARKAPGVRADVLRLHFHDCMVRGADGSVLLDGTGTERHAPPNFRLEGFEVIDAIKKELENRCPRTVSCADILSYAARAAVTQSGGPDWAVRGGRRDGYTSRAAEAVANLPGPDMKVPDLVATFARQGLSQHDMVVLSGAHTIGDAACVHIDTRIQSSPSDPILPKDFYDELKSQCPQPGMRVNPLVSFDRTTSTTFDSNYYSNLQVQKGLLTSDQALYEDATTRDMVLQNSKQQVFFENFKAAMVKLSEIGVLTGAQGEIRLNCNVVNGVDQAGQKGKGNGNGKGGKGK